MYKSKFIVIIFCLLFSNILNAKKDTLIKRKKYNVEFNLMAGVNAFNRIQPNYRNPFWKNVGFFSNFYFSLKAAKNFKIKNNYYVGISANAIYFENYSLYEIGTEKDKSTYYYRSEYYLNNKLLFLGINLRKNWQSKTLRLNGFSVFSIGSNLYSKTRYNGLTIEYTRGNLSGKLPFPDITILSQFQKDGWLKNKTLKSNLTYGLIIGAKSKFSRIPLCFTLGMNFSSNFPTILMSKYNVLFGVTIDLLN